MIDVKYYKSRERVKIMPNKHKKIFQLVVQPEENAVPRVVKLDPLDLHVIEVLVSLYRDSKVYPPHVNKIEALEDSLRLYVSSFFNWLNRPGENIEIASEFIGDTFARTMGFFPEQYPNCYQTFGYLASERPTQFTFKSLANSNISVGELKKEFELWYSSDHKLNGLQGITVRDFMRFYVHLLKRV